MFPVHRVVALAALILSLASCAESAQPPETAAPGSTFAVVGVAVVPMDSDRILPNQTVIVADGRIVVVGPTADVDVPPHAMRIDGRGRFLMPGLFDVHVHQERNDELLLYLANGVTTIVNLHGDPAALERQEALRAGSLIGPRLLTCGPPLRGEQHDAASAITMVREVAAAGYDCVKLRGDWMEEAFRSVSETTAEEGILFVGHAPRNLPFSVVLDDGREHIAHLEEIVYTTRALNDWIEGTASGEINGETADPRDALAGTVNKAAQEMVERGMWVTPTQIVIENYLKRSSQQGLKELAARPYLRFQDPVGRRRWALAADARYARFQKQVKLQRYMLEVFHEKGVKIAAGTDANFTNLLNVMPGWALHEELAIYQETGFSPYEALKTATVSAAAYMDLHDEGVIAPGGRADFILLTGNPFEDLANISTPLAVVVVGRWLGRRELDRRLAALERSYAPLESQLVELDAVMKDAPPEAWISAWRSFDNPDPAVASYLEGEINRRGYALLAEERIDEAITVFQLNAEAFPASANVYDSLAEAWLTKGDRRRAAELYKRALEVDPNFQNAAQMLEKLKAN